MSVVNDQYWLEYAKKTIENAITSINEAAARLEKMILWFWAVYTATFTIGVSTKALNAPFYILALLSSPILILIINYWFCNWVQMPVISEFNPIIPEEIRNSYNRSVGIKNFRYKVTLYLTLFSALTLASSLFLYSTTTKKEKNYINIEYISNEKLILIEAIVEPKTPVKILIDTINSVKPKLIYFTKSNENGLINFNSQIQNYLLGKKLNISLEYKTSDETYLINKTLKITD